MLIMREALLGSDRFEQFMARLDISRAVLTDRLAMLVAAGVLCREPAAAVRAAYVLTEAGRALAPVYERIGAWSADHLFADGKDASDWSAVPPAT